jgi:hypothetical protein
VIRLVNRLLATLFAGALAAFSAIVAVEIILGYYFERDPWLLPWDDWYRRSREVRWSDRSVVITFVLIGIAGILLLALQLWRRPPLSLPLENTRPDVHTEIDRRSLERVLTRAALSVDGVSGAHVRSRRSRVTVHAITQRRQPGDLRDRVNASAAGVLSGLRLQNQPRLAVDIHSRAIRGEV